MAVQPLRARNASIAVGLRLLGAPTEFIADACKTNLKSVGLTLKRHGIVPIFRRDFSVAGTSYRVTPEKHAELKLPKWVPMLADGVSYFNRRVADALMDALK